MSESEMLKAMYEDFNARRIEAVLQHMSPDVEWPNGMEGGYVHGIGAVRDYWQRQFAMIDPHVEPLSIAPRSDGRFDVQVQQTVHDLDGKLMTDRQVQHVYTISNGLIHRMEIVE
jgi:hypothetical protein